MIIIPAWNSLGDRVFQVTFNILLCLTPECVTLSNARLLINVEINYGSETGQANTNHNTKKKFPKMYQINILNKWVFIGRVNLALIYNCGCSLNDLFEVGTTVMGIKPNAIHMRTAAKGLCNQPSNVKFYFLHAFDYRHDPNPLCILLHVTWGFWISTFRGQYTNITRSWILD